LAVDNANSPGGDAPGVISYVLAGANGTGSGGGGGTAIKYVDSRANTTIAGTFVDVLQATPNIGSRSFAAGEITPGTKIKVSSIVNWNGSGGPGLDYEIKWGSATLITGSGGTFSGAGAVLIAAEITCVSSSVCAVSSYEFLPGGTPFYSNTGSAAVNLTSAANLVVNVRRTIGGNSTLVTSSIEIVSPSGGGGGGGGSSTPANVTKVAFTTASATWNITGISGLTREPIVQVFETISGTHSMIIPQSITVTTNSIAVTFSSPRTGFILYL
jgi:hypothetical protein